MDVAALTRLWDLRWPGMSKIPYEFTSDRAHWVRFHSLPQAKRYPETEAEYGVVLDRHNTVLSELVDTASVLVITAGHSERSEPAGDVRSAETVVVQPSAQYWCSALIDNDPDWWMNLYAGEGAWSPGALDGLLRLVADDVIADVTVAPPDLNWLYHPYDGGMDVILSSAAERNALRDGHRDWLSAHPGGL